jgi:DNA oxidative demethylase
VEAEEEGHLLSPPPTDRTNAVVRGRRGGGDHLRAQSATHRPRRRAAASVTLRGVARAPVEEPEGIVVSPEVITAEEEAGLLERFDTLRWDAIVIRGKAARRTARHFGLGYDYESRTPRPGEPIPEWLEPARAAAAELASVRPEELVEALVQRYPAGSTIGWHRDAPAFGIVIGISLLGHSRLRFQRGRGERRRTWEVALSPRSGYVLAGPARWSWEHSIPPAKELRYSITFRTLKRRD